MDDLKFGVLTPVRLGGSLSPVGASNPVLSSGPASVGNAAADTDVLVVFDDEPSATVAPTPSLWDLEPAKPARTEPAAAPPQHQHLPNSQTGASGPQKLISLVAPYCDISTLFMLSQTSRDARAAAIDDEIWIPICRTLGIKDIQYDPNDLTSMATPATVLDLGYAKSEHSGYTTFRQAYALLNPVVENAKQAVAAMEQTHALGHVDKARIFTSALRLRQVLLLMSGEDITGDAIDSSLDALVEDEKEELAESFARSLEDGSPLLPLINAYNIWWQRLDLDNMRQQAVELYYAKHEIELEAEDCLSFDGVSGEQTISMRKLSLAFGALATYLNGTKRALLEPSLGIPENWLGFMRSVFFDKFTRLVTGYADSVLQMAEKISVLEYLSTVPKVYAASRSLLENEALDPAGDFHNAELKELLRAHFLDNMVEQFCDRQRPYFEQHVRERVKKWVDSISERESETERFIWSSVPRKREKTNFVSAFKWAFSSSNNQADDDDTFENARAISDGTESTPQTEFEAQTAVLVSKFRGMESLVSIELVIGILEDCRAAFHRFKGVDQERADLYEPIFVSLMDIVGRHHIKHAFEKAIKVLNSYDPKRHGRLVISVDHAGQDADGHTTKSSAVEPLIVFTELVNVGDLVQQMIHVFFEDELVATKLVRKSNFGSQSVTSKRKFEQMLDDMLAEGLSRGIDVLMDQVEFTLVTEQLGSDYLPLPTQEPNLGPTTAALKVIDLVKSHLDLLKDSTEKALFDVFQQEVGMRLFAALSSHIKKQTISVDGAITLISDVNAYYAFVLTLKQKPLTPFYEALKRVVQLYLVDAKDAKQIGTAISDASRYNGVIPTEELVEFLKRRQDWPLVKGKVERVLYGVFECIIC